MITSANIKTHSGIININNTLIQWGAKGGELCCSCASAIKIIRGESQAEPAEKESIEGMRGGEQCDRGLWPPGLGINNTRRETCCCLGAL